MKKSDLDKLIKVEIKKQVVRKVKHLSSTNPERTNNLPQEEAIDFDSTLFHGGEKPIGDDKETGPITIKENVENITIKSYEVEEFEKNFADFLANVPSATYQLLKQENGYTVIAYKTAGGVEVKSAGVISLGDLGKINFSYSILDGLRINAQNMQITQDNKVLFELLYNNYDSWQKNWRLKLSL